LNKILKRELLELLKREDFQLKKRKSIETEKQAQENGLEESTTILLKYTIKQEQKQ